METPRHGQVVLGNTEIMEANAVVLEESSNNVNTVKRPVEGYSLICFGKKLRHV